MLSILNYEIHLALISYSNKTKGDFSTITYIAPWINYTTYAFKWSMQPKNT
jgi:hypothetical protein